MFNQHRKRMLGRPILIVVLGFSATGICAQGEQSTDLKTAYESALAHDAKLSAAKSGLEADHELVGFARSYLLPSVSAVASGGYSKSVVDYASTNQNSGPQDKATPYYEKYGYSLRLTQPIYRKNYIDGYRQAHYLEDQGELRYLGAEQDIILRVSQAYFDLLLAKNNVELSEVETQATAKHLETSKKALGVGRATITEVYDAQARYDLTLARALVARNQLEIAQQSLSRLIGYEPKSLARLRDEFELISPEPKDINAWKSSAAKDSISVRVARAAVDVARLEVEKQRGLAYPALDLVVSYGSNYVGDGTFGGENTSNNTSATLELNVPLFAGGAVSIKTRQLVAEKKKADYLLEDAVREAELQAQQVYSAVISSIEQIKALQQVEKSSQSSLDVTQKGFEHGLRTLIDVLNAQQQLYTAKRDLAAAKYQYLINRMKLKAVVGQLSESDIEGANGVLYFPKL